jgi:hypothetical protein
MDEHTSSVALFFGLTPEGGGVPKEMTAAVAEATKKAVQQAATHVSVIKTVLEHGLPSVQWTAAGNQVVDLLRNELASLSIPALLAKGWTKYAPFREYCKEPKYTPNKRYVVPLYKHTLSSKHRPVIELRLDGLPAGKVNFEVELSLTFESAALVIQNKRFMSVTPGTAEAKGTLKCEGAQILERKLDKISLPGEISFGDGFPIEPFAASTEPPAPAVA